MDENTMDKQSSPKSSLFDGWNAPPNLVTYSRIVLVVFFLTLDILAGAWGENNLTMRWVAAVLFIIAASTDKIDGWMAANTIRSPKWASSWIRSRISCSLAAQ